MEAGRLESGGGGGPGSAGTKEQRVDGELPAGDGTIVIATTPTTPPAWQ